jgi:hypothetical protein
MPNKNSKELKVKNHPFIDKFKSAFTLVFGGTFGYISSMAIIVLYTVFFCGIGFFIVDYYNKEDTTYFEEIQNGQYIGIIFILIGLLPWLHTFFQGFMIESGILVAERFIPKLFEK